MSNKLSRRQLISTGIATGIATGAAASLNGCVEKSHNFTTLAKTANDVFAHSIASGDPTDTNVVIWTRISAPAQESVMVKWQVSETADFVKPLVEDFFRTSAARDWTVKIDVSNLPSGRKFYYRFSVNDAVSPIGTTRTLPNGTVSDARFAFTSCANWQHGLFNAYHHIAEQETYDAVVILGDYIYEYGLNIPSKEKAQKLGRLHEPPHETITLDDYRIRHAQYKTDTSLQAMHEKHPVICLWDDHEVANDSHTEGAQNHSPEKEGVWQDRVKVAMQAYYEWMPVRDPEPGRPREALFKSYSWGDLLTLTSIETRLMSRSQQIEPDDYIESFVDQAAVDHFKNNILGDPKREMLGQEQTQFVIDAFTKSKTNDQPWRLLANQTLMAKLLTPNLAPHVDEASITAIESEWPIVRQFVEKSKFNLPLYSDTWSGYPTARERFYNALDNAGINDMIVLTGDSHEYWVNDLHKDDDKKIGLELGVSSISSNTLKYYMGEATEDYSLLTTKENKEARYYNAMENGYIELNFSRKSGQAKFVTVSTVDEPSYEAKTTAAFNIKRTDDTVKLGRAKGLNFKQWVLYKGFV